MNEQEKRENVINGLEEVMEFIAATKNMFEIGFPNIVSDIYDNALDVIYDAIALLKAQEPSDDWISRKRLKNEIQYYIEEAGWGEEINKALGWCLEFIDNQEAVKWE